MNILCLLETKVMLFLFFLLHGYFGHHLCTYMFAVFPLCHLSRFHFNNVAVLTLYLALIDFTPVCTVVNLTRL